MTTEELLSRLDGVRRQGRGWTARCPAHHDKTPSLSVSEGDKGILVKCWSGCTVEEITRALGVAVSDLFYDGHADPREIHKRRLQRDAERKLRETALRREGRMLDVIREAESFIASARDIDSSSWSDRKLHQVLNQLANAYAVLEGDPYG